MKIQVGKDDLLESLLEGQYEGGGLAGGGIHQFLFGDRAVQRPYRGDAAEGAAFQYRGDLGVHSLQRGDVCEFNAHVPTPCCLLVPVYHSGRVSFNGIFRGGTGEFTAG